MLEKAWAKDYRSAGPKGLPRINRRFSIPCINPARSLSVVDLIRHAPGHIHHRILEEAKTSHQDLIVS